MHPCIRALILIGAGLLALPASTGFAQTSAPASEIDQLRQELRRMQERLQKLEQAPPAPAPVAGPASQPIPVAQVPPMAPRPGEREILLDRDHPLEVFGLSKPELGGARISGFFVGSANYNSRLQMVPEFAGSIPVSSEPNRVDFRFDSFTFGVYKTFASWLSAGASLEVENAVHRHSHGFDPDFGCPGMDRCVEQFGSEPGTTEVSLHRMNITGIAPLGNGLAISFGRFDTPYGYERHDAALNFTATTSELTRFGKPQSYTGFQVAYAFAPWLDVTGWIANQWENETTENGFQDNNSAKSVGGRVGVTPFQGDQWLNFGIGGWVGAEGDSAPPRHPSVTPAVHLSRLIPELRPLGVTYARTRMPLDWVDVRLEYRLDTSDKNVFSNAKPGIPVTSADKTAQQVTLQFVVNY